MIHKIKQSRSEKMLLIFYFILLFTPITFWVIDQKFQNYLNIKDDKS